MHITSVTKGPKSDGKSYRINENQTLNFPLYTPLPIRVYNQEREQWQAKPCMVMTQYPPSNHNLFSIAGSLSDCEQYLITTHCPLSSTSV